MRRAAPVHLVKGKILPGATKDFYKDPNRKKKSAEKPAGSKNDKHTADKKNTRSKTTATKQHNKTNGRSQANPAKERGQRQRQTNRPTKGKQQP